MPRAPAATGSAAPACASDAAIQELYRVVLTKREPVGMVYLWPEVRG